MNEHGFYLSIGATLAGMVNFETLPGGTPHILPNGHISILPPLRSRTGASTPFFQGVIDGALYYDALTRYEFNRAIYTILGGFDVPYVERYIVTRDAEHHLSPFKVRVIQPRPPSVDDEGDYTLRRYGDIEALTLPLWKCELQSVALDEDATLTASQRLAVVDTTSGDVEITLPAAADVEPDTIMGVHKAAAANELTLTPGGSDTLTPITVTDLGTRITVVSNGVSSWTQFFSYDEESYT